MAKVRRNIVMEGFTGSLGKQLVIRIDKRGQTIISRMPTFAENRQFTDLQTTCQKQFRDAVAYAKVASKTEPVYAEKALEHNRTAYHIAIADFLHPPQILNIDVSGYTGKPGENIRAQVQDDVKVKAVSIVITNELGQVIEQGAATPDTGLWWRYTTTVDAPSASAKVVVHAWDLPGNETIKQAG